MSTLGRCDAGVSRSIRKVFQLLLNDAFVARFGHSGPRHTTSIRDRGFLPHLLQTATPWRHIRLDYVRSSLSIGLPSWNRSLVTPQ